ncbi:type II secretion system F family protein [Amycolatopsis pigmentata]|uniref:Type II secretion system F family protein n=1 Tax=Amycolatopsis pigmentata TaxID=450801 RepID=A0ABW5FZP7_9PSEU
MTPAHITISATTVLAAVLGLGAGVGLLLVIIGWRGVDPNRRPGPFGRLWSQRASVATQDRRWILRIALAFAVGVAIGLATGWIAASVLAGLAVWALPRLVGREPEQTRRVARIEAIATWTEMLRDTLSAAAGLEQAILATAQLAPQAIRGEVGELAARIENGDRLAHALRILANRLADPTGDLVIAALLLAAEQHARQLSDLLGSLAHAAREQASMRMRVEAGRARTRTSVRVIVGTTLTFAVAVVLFNRGYLSAYDSTTGQIVLLGIGVLFSSGIAWLARIAAVPEPERFLVEVSTAAGQGPAIAERQV